MKQRSLTYICGPFQVLTVAVFLTTGCTELVKPTVLESEVDDAFTQVRADARQAGDEPGAQISPEAVVDSATALDASVSLTLFNEPLSEVLPLIVSEIEWGQDVDPNLRASIDVDSVSVADALDAVLKPAGLFYLRRTHGIRVERQPLITFRAFKQPLHIVLSSMLGSINLPYIVRDGAGTRLDTLLNAQYDNTPVEQALDRLLAPIGLFWQRKGLIYEIYRDTERLYHVNFPLLEQQFQVQSTRSARSPKSQTTTTSAGLSREGTRYDVEGGVSASTSIAAAFGESASLKNLSGTLEGFISDDGQLVIHQEMGTIWVRDHADIVKRMGLFLDDINASLSRSVRVRGVITEVMLNDDKQFGVDWKAVTQDVVSGLSLGNNYGGDLGGVGRNADGAFTTNAALNSFPINVNTVQSAQNILTINTQSRSGSEAFNLFIKALRSYGDVRVVSRPSLIVNNGAVGSLIVGDTISYVAQAYTSQTSGSSLTNSIIVQPLQTGLGFYVLPHIVSDDLAVLYVSPELTSLQELRSIQNGNNVVEAPQINMKQTQTVVSLQNGQSIILGGLMQETESDVRQSVPLLGDIPIIGALFKSTSKQRRITEFALMLEVSW